MPMRKIEKMHEQLIAIAARSKPDTIKFDGGNQTAGIRIRQTMQDVRDFAKRIRDEVQRIKKARKNLRKDHATDAPDRKISVPRR